MRTCIRYVTANRSADERRDREEIDLLGQHRIAQRGAHRRPRHPGHVAGQRDHQETQHHDQSVHRHARPWREEDADRDQRRCHAAPQRRNAEHGVEAQPAARHVADVEDEPAEHHEKREHATDAGQQPLAEFLRTQAGDADHAPDIQLQRDVDEDRRDDRKRERRTELRRELRRLRDEARADRAGGHEEHGAKHRAAARGACRDVWRLVVHGPPRQQPVASGMRPSYASRRLTRAPDGVRTSRMVTARWQRA